VALTGCRLAEHGRRAAIDAFASFVLDSVLEVQKAAPLRQAKFNVGQALMPVPTVPPPPQDRQECLSYIETPKLPAPQPRIAAIDLKPAARVELCRIDVARARVEARMALAELRGTRFRVVVVTQPAAL